MEFTQKEYSIPDQPLRVAQAKEANNQRFLDIDQFYKPELVKGKKVLVTGKVNFKMDGSMDGCTMDRWMDRWMDVQWIDGWM